MYYILGIRVIIAELLACYHVISTAAVFCFSPPMTHFPHVIFEALD